MHKRRRKNTTGQRAEGIARADRCNISDLTGYQLAFNGLKAAAETVGIADHRIDVIFFDRIINSFAKNCDI